MLRIGVAIGIAASFAAIIFYAGTRMGRADDAGATLALYGAALAFILSVLAMTIAAVAVRVAIGNGQDLQRIGRGIDAALRDFAQRSSGKTIEFGEFSAEIRKQVDAITVRLPAGRDDASRADARTPPAKVGQTPHDAATRAADMDKAIGAAIATGAFSLALQPIVSIGNGAAAGFDVYANLALPGGASADVRRLEIKAQGAKTSQFELALLTAAAGSGRRSVGDDAERTPLHIALSAAALADKSVLDRVCELFKLHSGLRKSIVLSLPADLAASADRVHADALARLTELKVPLAIEGWPDNDASAIALPLAYAKLSADILLDRRKAAGTGKSGFDLVESAASRKIAVIATEVDSDDDVVALLDLGIDLMVGPKFSGPRRLRAPSQPSAPGSLH
jgi:cyclic-di-GMP phosphodiesterase, flagellum assembly factor TipF